MMRTQYVQARFEASEEYSRVVTISDKLLHHLNTPLARSAIKEANSPGQSSAVVQAIFQPFAEGLGFSSEVQGLFQEYQNRALRPDYFMPLAESQTGILLEVERGKTTTNNMDLLDLWKCHVCVSAHYLFLLVPQELRHNPIMSPKREYNSVAKRMASFFVEGNYTNVRGLHVFGY